MSPDTVRRLRRLARRRTREVVLLRRTAREVEVQRPRPPSPAR